MENNNLVFVIDNPYEAVQKIRQVVEEHSEGALESLLETPGSEIIEELTEYGEYFESIPPARITELAKMALKEALYTTQALLFRFPDDPDRACMFVDLLGDMLDDTSDVHSAMMAYIGIYQVCYSDVPEPVMELFGKTNKDEILALLDIYTGFLYEFLEDAIDETTNECDECGADLVLDGDDVETYLRCPDCDACYSLDEDDEDDEDGDGEMASNVIRFPKALS